MNKLTLTDFDLGITWTAVFTDDRLARRDENSACLITSEDMKKTYVMAESEAYFEAYRHVLAGLQGDIDFRVFVD